MRVDPRRRELALIHMAQKNLALAEDSYRALLERVCGVQSAGDLDAVGRQRLLTHFRSLGWDPAKHRAPSRAGARVLDDDPTSRKLRAMWIALWNLGAVRNSEEAALAAFVKRQTGVDALQFLRPEQAHRAIEALKAWCARYGFEPEAGQDSGETMRALLYAQWTRLHELGAAKLSADLALQRWAHDHSHPRKAFGAHTVEELQALSDKLGRWVRQAGARTSGNTEAKGGVSA